MKNYATEGVTKEGKPNGHFFITKDQAKTIGQEVVESHLNFKGSKKDQYMKENFDETWDSFDVN